MTKFLLDTDTVSSAAGTISTLSSTISDLSSTVNGWDTSNEDGFDFDTAKATIAANIDACAAKVNKTALAMESVVEAHTQVQNSLKFELEPEEKKEDNKENQNDGTNNYGGQRGGSRTSSGGRRSSSGYRPSSHTRSAPTAPSEGVKVSPVVPPVPNKPEEKNKEIEETPKTENQIEQETPKAENQIEQETPKTENTNVTDSNNNDVIKEEIKIDDISYAAPKAEQLSEESRKIINNEASSSDNGYTMIEDRYVIATDPSVGKVGDVIKFTTSDNKTIECVIGVNTVTDTNKNKMFFLVDENKGSVTPFDGASSFMEKSTKIENMGNYKNNMASNSSVGNIAATGYVGAETTTGGQTKDSYDEEISVDTEGDDSNG